MTAALGLRHPPREQLRTFDGVRRILSRRRPTPDERQCTPGLPWTPGMVGVGSGRQPTPAVT